MFFQAEKFESDLSGWDMSNNFHMESMFDEASKFTSDLSGWDEHQIPPQHHGRLRAPRYL
jgi:hypothetical protein